MPLVTALLAASLVAVYGLELASGGEAFCSAHGLIPAHPSFETALTSMWLHDPVGLGHLGGNLAFLLLFGAIVELELGGLFLLGLFGAAGLGGAFFHVLVNPGATGALVGCSGALFGLMAVAGVLRPRLLGFVVAFVALNLWNAFTGGGENVSWSAHLGGFVVGAIVVVFMRVVGHEALEAA